MQAELVKTFHFEAAHHLPNTPDGHKCRRMHGHNYRVDVHILGPVDPQAGWVMDFGRFKAIVKPVIDTMDHRLLNDLPGLENCTAELIAKFIWDHIAGDLPGLTAVVVWESDTSRCLYRGQSRSE